MDERQARGLYNVRPSQRHFEEDGEVEELREADGAYDDIFRVGALLVSCRTDTLAMKCRCCW